MKPGKPIARGKLLFGIALILISLLLQIILALVPHEPAPEYPPVLLGMVRSQSGPAELKLLTTAEGGFIPLALLGAKNPRHIPQTDVNFDIDEITSAATRGNLSKLRINDAAEFIWTERSTVADGKPCLAVWTNSEGAFTDYYHYVSIYSGSGVALQTYYLSKAPVIAWKLSGDRQTLLVHYSQGLCGYRWDGAQYSRDRSAQYRHPLTLLAMTFKGWFGLSFLSVRTLLLAIAALAFWLIRGLVNISVPEKFRRPSQVWRWTILIFILGPLLFLSAFFFVFAIHENNYLGLFLFPAILAWAGWALIAVSAVNPAVPKPLLEPGRIV